MTDMRLWLHLLERINHQERTHIMSTELIVARLEALDAAVAKVGTETTALVGEVATLKAAIAAAGVDEAAVTAALSAVEARVAAVDALVPDAPVDEPVTPTE
jgi:hypothetical protein